MRAVIPCFIVIAIILHSVAELSEAAPATTQSAADKPAIVIPLHRGRDRIFAIGKVNETEVGYFGIDTGAAFTSISSDIAKRLGAKTLGGRWVSTQTGRAKFDLAVADSFTVGDLHLKNQLLYVEPTPSAVNNAKDVIAGVIGMDVLGSRCVRIDFLTPALSFYDSPPTHLPLGEVFELQPQHDTPNFKGKVEDAAGWFQLDTGHGYGFRLSPGFVALNPDLIRGRPHINESVPWPENAEVYSMRWESFEALGKTFTPIDGDFQVGPKGIEGPSGLVGPGFFRNSVVTIDMKARKLWVDSHPTKETAEEFLRRFPVDAPLDLEGYTSLHHAAIRLNAEAAAALLKKGADVNAVDYVGISPLIIAAGRGDVELTQVLLKAGARLDVRTSIDSFTALLLAAQYGRTETVQLLLDDRDDINTASKTGRTPLLVAVDADHLDTAKLLIERGAKVDKALSTGETPVMAAARNGDAQMLSLLLDNGADSNKVVASGSPLIYAAQSASAPCVKRLLDENAQVNDPRPDGLTPLMSAAQTYRAADCVKLLLDAGADLNAKSKDGRRVLDYAVQSGSPQTVNLIVSRLKLKAEAK